MRAKDKNISGTAFVNLCKWEQKIKTSPDWHSLTSAKQNGRLHLQIRTKDKNISRMTFKNICKLERKIRTSPERHSLTSAKQKGRMHLQMRTKDKSFSRTVFVNICRTISVHFCNVEDQNCFWSWNLKRGSTWKWWQASDTKHVSLMLFWTLNFCYYCENEIYRMANTIRCNAMQ